MSAAALSRWFVRCTTCLSVSAIDEHPASVMQCGLCSGRLENMGRVERDRLIHEYQAAPCDDRCTNARGPLCSCKCGGKHHGTHMLVTVTHDAGKVPTVTPRTVEKARIIAAEYTNARAAALALLDALNNRKQATGWLPPTDFRALRELQAALRKAHEARDHRARMRTLRAVLPDLQPFNAPPRDDRPIVPLPTVTQIGLFA